MKVLVTGATGFIGKVLVKKLLEGGDEVIVLTRNISRAAMVLGSSCQYFKWSGRDELPPSEAFAGVEAVINLVGENISARRWTAEQKEILSSSRIEATQKLVEVISGLKTRPKIFVSASAVGIYGNRESEEITEASALGNDFLAQLCIEWEAAANKARDLGCRVAILRTGIVIGRSGGAIAKMLPVFKLGLGGPIGNGKQFMSWIHVDDLVKLYIQCLKHSSMEGVYNGTAPYPATNTDFTKSLSRAVRRPAKFNMPHFMLKFLFGEMSEMLLGGQKILPMRVKELQFRYHHATLDRAMKVSAF